MIMEVIIPSNDHNSFQYIIYDWNSLLADVGGYLGLLVGQSIFGMYQLMTSWMNWNKATQLFMTRRKQTIKAIERRPFRLPQCQTTLPGTRIEGVGFMAIENDKESSGRSRRFVELGDIPA